MNMKLKKETKHTCVYEAEDGTEVVPVRSVYVDKVWLALQITGSTWPTSIQLTIKLP